MVKEYRELRKRLSGPEAAPYVNPARKLLGDMKERMKHGGLQVLTWKKNLSDGVEIEVSSIFGQDEVRINVPVQQKPVRKSEKKRSRDVVFTLWFFRNESTIVEFDPTSRRLTGKQVTTSNTAQRVSGLLYAHDALWFSGSKGAMRVDIETGVETLLGNYYVFAATRTGLIAGDDVAIALLDKQGAIISNLPMDTYKVEMLRVVGNKVYSVGTDTSTGVGFMSSGAVVDVVNDSLQLSGLTKNLYGYLLDNITDPDCLLSSYRSSLVYSRTIESLHIKPQTNGCTVPSPHIRCYRGTIKPADFLTGPMTTVNYIEVVEPELSEEFSPRRDEAASFDLITSVADRNTYVLVFGVDTAEDGLVSIVEIRDSVTHTILQKQVSTPLRPDGLFNARMSASWAGGDRVWTTMYSGSFPGTRQLGNIDLTTARLEVVPDIEVMSPAIPGDGQVIAVQPHLPDEEDDEGNTELDWVLKLQEASSR